MRCEDMLLFVSMEKHYWSFILEIQEKDLVTPFCCQM